MAILIVSVVHGFVIAQIASWLGDAEPAHQGRRSLNPFSHFDLIGGAGLLLFGLGWIRPIQIEKAELRNPPRDLIVMAACGLIAVFLVAALAYVSRQVAITTLTGGPAIAAVAILDTTARIGIWFTLFNILPIPPLTGRYFGYAFLANASVRKIDRYTRRATVVLGLLIVTGLVSGLLAVPLRAATNGILNWL